MSRHSSLSKTVLLVDDLDLMRTMIRDFLESQGMQVFEASSGVEAIRIASSYTGVVNLLLADIEMPEMSGWELAAKIAESRPEIRVLYMSAGVSSQEWKKLKDRPVGAYFIQKPFRLKDLKLLLDRIFAK
jgi:two-component system cell cycle sensor histidine kinase/response regulator CckA